MYFVFDYFLLGNLHLRSCFFYDPDRIVSNPFFHRNLCEKTLMIFLLLHGSAHQHEGWRLTFTETMGHAF